MNEEAIPKTKRNRARILGPILSVLAHVAIVILMLNAIGFVRKPQEEKLRFEMSSAQEIELDKILPVEPPDVSEADALSPAPLAAADVAAMADAQDLDVAPASDDISMLDNLSPLTITGVGADLAAQGTLTSRYGNRAVQNGLLGSYFNRIDFTGETFMRIDETLNDQWELDSPWKGRVRPDLFSIIWTGRIVPPRTGEYTFYLQSDDGARLWIDGKLVLDQFVERQRETDEVKIHMLVGRSYDIKYAFCDVYQHAISRLEWSCEEAGIPRQLIPSEHMWADGASTRQMIAWNEEVRRGTAVDYPNRKLMRNPAMIESKPFSQIVGFEALDEKGLPRLDLESLVDDFHRYKQSGRAPSDSLLPAWPAGHDTERAEPSDKDQDVIITIM